MRKRKNGGKKKNFLKETIGSTRVNIISRSSALTAFGPGPNILLRWLKSGRRRDWNGVTSAVRPLEGRTRATSGPDSFSVVDLGGR